MSDGRMEELEQHLLFHKAMADDAAVNDRINGYMEILSKADTGERLQDPVDEAIRSVFSLVLENGIDPWEIDLSEFSRMYTRKVEADAFDMIVAGKLVLMAWKILRLQSEATCTMSEPPEEEVWEEPDESFDAEEDEAMYVPDFVPPKAYQRNNVRPVTVLELIDAFEDARKEIEVQQERERVRAELKAKAPKDPKFDNKAHDEDDERDVEEVWKRIRAFGPVAIRMEDLYSGDANADLTTFVSVLHLARDGFVDVWQDEPYGQIHVEAVPGGPEEGAGAAVKSEV